MSMQHARSTIEGWRIEYNTERPHSSLDDQTPEEFEMRTLLGVPPIACAKT